MLTATPAPVEYDRRLEDLRPALLRTAHGFTRNYEAAEDLLQEVLAQAVPHLAEIPTDRIAAYLRTALRNGAATRARRLRVRPEPASLDALLFSQPDLAFPGQPASDPLHALLAQERRELTDRWIGSALSRLHTLKPQWATAIQTQYSQVEGDSCDPAERQRRSRGLRWLRERAAQEVNWR